MECRLRISYGFTRARWGWYCLGRVEMPYFFHIPPILEGLPHRISYNPSHFASSCQVVYSNGEIGTPFHFANSPPPPKNLNSQSGNPWDRHVSAGTPEMHLLFINPFKPGTGIGLVQRVVYTQATWCLLDLGPTSWLLTILTETEILNFRSTPGCLLHPGDFKE